MQGRNITEIKILTVLSFLITLSACGGGGSSYDYAPGGGYDPSPSPDVYATTEDLPEGLFVTFDYPYYSIDGLEIQEAAHCTPYYTGDCVIFSGSPHNLSASEKYYVLSTDQIYYRISDLYDNPYSYEEYWYSMNVYGYSENEIKVINQAKVTFTQSSLGPRHWIIEVETSERHFWLRNNTFFYQDYALIRFDDDFVYWEFEQNDLGIFDDKISFRLYSYFESYASNYGGLTWNDISIFDYEIIETNSIDPLSTVYYSNIPDGLTCVVPVDFYGYPVGDLADAGCQYNLDIAEFSDAQWYRSYDLDIY